MDYGYIQEQSGSHKVANNKRTVICIMPKYPKRGFHYDPTAKDEHGQSQQHALIEFMTTFDLCGVRVSPISEEGLSESTKS